MWPKKKKARTSRWGPERTETGGVRGKDLSTTLEASQVVLRDQLDGGVKENVKIV